jgi:hypothetical protein
MESGQYPSNVDPLWRGASQLANPLTLSLQLFNQAGFGPLGIRAAGGWSGTTLSGPWRVAVDPDD